ncbi:MAG: pyruvate kinase [Candidatus Aminicenantales bacterium]
MPRTKIVCTIGPASRSSKILAELISTGMSVARLNFSHGSHAEHGAVISDLRRLALELGRPVAILQDLGGPKIRVGPVAGGTVMLEPGSLFTLTGRRVPGSARSVSISYPALPRDVRRGDTLLLGDGAIELRVSRVTPQDIKCRVIIGGPLSSHKGINLPSRSLRLPAITEKDEKDLAFGIRQKVDYIALSFVRNAKDILKAKKLMAARKCAIPLIAKIEKHEALDNIDEIIPLVQAVMVARGDLGVEIPLESVPRIQKWLIQKSNAGGKPVITATQMLRSMVENPRPTRAEVADVANAVLDGTDAVMLSEETAIGRFPVEAVRMIARVVADAERIFPYADWTRKWWGESGKSLSEAVALSACTLADEIRAAAIISFTQSGLTARLVSKFRPACPILALTSLPKTYRHLSLVWGVTPVMVTGLKTTDDVIDRAFEAARSSGLVKRDQKVVITAGVPLGVPGKTNLIKAEILR